MNNIAERISKSIHRINKKIYNGGKDLFIIKDEFKIKINSKFSHSELTQIYLNEVIGLARVLNKIETTNPFKEKKLNCYHRVEHKYLFDDEDRNEYYGDEYINKETMIQRNLFYNKKSYKKTLGMLIGYEVTIPKNKRLFPIDLIGIKYDGNKLVINLIELKTCELKIRKYNRQQEKYEITTVNESKELLLRAIFEITTYYSAFKYALEHKEDGLCKKLMSEINKNLNLETTEEMVRNANIKRVIVAPESMIDGACHYNELLNNIELITIKTNESFKDNSKVGMKKKFFDLKKIDI